MLHPFSPPDEHFTSAHLPTDRAGLEADPDRVSLSVVQGEWAQTLRRLGEVCAVTESSDPLTHRLARLTVRLQEGATIEAVDTILFDNLLFAPWTRTAHQGLWTVVGEWLWRWRMAVPWRADQLGGISLLPPGVNGNQWCYRFNVVAVEGL